MSSMQPSSNDPLTDMLAPAATVLACTAPDSQAYEASSKLNPGQSATGELYGWSDPVPHSRALVLKYPSDIRDLNFHPRPPPPPSSFTLPACCVRNRSGGP